MTDEVRQGVGGICAALALLLVAAFAHDLSEMLFAALLFAAGLTGFVGLGTIAYALLLRPSSSDE